MAISMISKLEFLINYIHENLFKVDKRIYTVNELTEINQIKANSYLFDFSSYEQ